MGTAVPATVGGATAEEFRGRRPRASCSGSSRQAVHCSSSFFSLFPSGSRRSATMTVFAFVTMSLDIWDLLFCFVFSEKHFQNHFVFAGFFLFFLIKAIDVRKDRQTSSCFLSVFPLVLDVCLLLQLRSQYSTFLDCAIDGKMPLGNQSFAGLYTYLKFWCAAEISPWDQLTFLSS